MVDVIGADGPVSRYVICYVFRYFYSEFCKVGFYSWGFRSMGVWDLPFNVGFARRCFAFRVRGYHDDDYDCAVLADADFDGGSYFSRFFDGWRLAWGVISFVDPDIIWIFAFWVGFDSAGIFYRSFDVVWWE